MLARTDCADGLPDLDEITGRVLPHNTEQASKAVRPRPTFPHAAVKPIATRSYSAWLPDFAAQPWELRERRHGHSPEIANATENTVLNAFHQA